MRTCARTHTRARPLCRGGSGRSWSAAERDVSDAPTCTATHPEKRQNGIALLGATARDSISHPRITTEVPEPARTDRGRDSN